ncbi:MAG: pilus assembly protein [Sandarakinorhabdus sp.]|nr:pilus assembly protein [Sandarakinorhabdus sp.]
MKILRNLLRDRRGSSAVELVLMAPMLTLAMLAAFDLSIGFWGKLNLAAAASRAADLATSPGAVRTDYTFLKAEAETAANMTNAVATVTSSLECDGVTQAANVTVCNAGQSFARYVSISVVAPYKPSFSYGGLINASGITIGGAATVRIQ